MADFDKISINGTYYNVKDSALTAAVNALTTEVGEVQNTVTRQGQTIQQQGQAIQQQGQDIENLKTEIANAPEMYININDYEGDFDSKISAAINDCPYHGTIYIPAGQYKSNRTITINKPLTILGNYVGWDPEAIPVSQYEAVAITSTASTAISVQSIGVTLKNISLMTAPDSVALSLQVANANNQVMRDFHIENAYLIGQSDTTPSNTAILCPSSIIVSSFTKVVIRNFVTGFNLGEENQTSTSLSLKQIWVRNTWNIGIWLKGAIYSHLDTCVVESGVGSSVVAGFYLGNCHAISLTSCAAEGISKPALSALTSKGISVLSFASINCNSGGQWQIEVGNDSLVAGFYTVGSPQAGKFGDNCGLIGAQNAWYDASNTMHAILKGIIDTTADKQ